MIENVLTAKQLLESKLKEVTSLGGWRDSIAIRPSADVAYTTQHALTRDMACRDLDRNASLARHLRAALDRIADGTYGLCMQCEEPISKKRLAALPWTPFCLSCQEEVEAVHLQNDRSAA